MYTIDSEKLADVTRILNDEVDPKVTEETVEAGICGDWHEGADHQEWIDGATAREIADWLASFYGAVEEAEKPFYPATQW